jgi:hypothetical protein
MMSSINQHGLARILILDAATCAAMGLLLLLLAAPVAELTAIPATLLFWAGAVLIPVAGYMALVARLGAGNPLAVGLVIVGNLGWVVASLALFALIAPNGVGAALIAGQALVVALLAWLEFREWHRAVTRRHATA